MTPRYCRQCAQSRALSEETIFKFSPFSNWHCVRCTGCGATLVDSSGNCDGSCEVEEHKITSKWEECWEALKVWAKEKKYWLVCHLQPSKRFHMLDLRNPLYGYGWSDADDRMLFACFNLLQHFVEQEKGLEKWPEGDKRADEVKDLYVWWVDVWPNIDHERFDKQKEIETEMLNRLMAVRPYLWT